MKQLRFKPVPVLVTAAVLLAGAALVAGVLLLAGGRQGKTEAPAGAYQPKPMDLPIQNTSPFEQHLQENALYFESQIGGVDTGIDLTHVNVLDISSGKTRVLYRQPADEEGWVDGLAPDQDGSVWFIFKRRTDEMSQSDSPVIISRLLHYSVQGEKLADIDLAEVLQKEESGSELFVADDQLYLAATRRAQDEEGVWTNQHRLYLLDRQGKRLSYLDSAEGQSLREFLPLADGRVALVGSDAVVPLEDGGRAWGEPIPLTLPDTSPEEPPYLRVFPSEGRYLFLVQADNERVYGYDSAAGQYALLFNWADEDIVWESVGAMQMAQDGSLLAVNLSEGYGVRMVPCAPQEKIQKATLTLAGLQITDRYEQDVQDFNRRSTTSRIQIKDYAQDVGIEEGVTKMNTEILGGDIPDIICLENGVSAGSLVKQGLLEDLYPLLDGDEELGRDAFVDGILPALETDGKLYQIAPSFSLQTALSDTRVTGGKAPLSWEEADRLLDANPDKALFNYDMMRESLEVYLSRVACGSYIDWENGECKLDNTAFIRTLEEAKKLPTTMDVLGESMSEEWLQKAGVDELAEGKILLQYTSLASVADYQRALTRLGEHTGFTGVPTDTGTGTWLAMSGAFAITKDCQDKEGAWQFMRRYLIPQEGEKTYFSTNKAAFEAELAEAMKEGPFLNDLGEPILVYGEPLAPLTQAGAGRLRELIRTATPSIGYNAEIASIITAEASYYFADKCTAAEAAANMQQRVGLYLSEQM